MVNKGWMKAIIIAVVLLIPIIYSFFYLKSYWDPYGNLTDMKIAIVNLDKGNEESNEGENFVKELKDSDIFKIVEVSKEEADKGMEKSKYYATIIIPETFTEDLNSVSTSEKQISEIKYCPNQASNYLGTQIVGSAMKTIEKNLKIKIDSNITQSLADNLKEVPDNLKEIADGSEKLLNGSGDLNSGIDKINNGTSELNKKYTEFDDGVSALLKGSKELQNGFKSAETGAEKLKDGAKNLNDAIKLITSGTEELEKSGKDGIQALSDGINDINNGTTSLKSGVDGYVDGVGTFVDGTTRYVESTGRLCEGMNSYIEGVDTLNSNTEALLKTLATQTNSDNQTLKALAQKANQIISSGSYEKIKNSGGTIKQSSDKLTESNSTLKQGASNLKTSGTELKQGATDLSDGTALLLTKSGDLSKITEGISTLKDSLKVVESGSDTLETGMKDLKDGTTTLKNGNTKLANGIKTLDSSSTKIKTALETLNKGTESASEGSNKLVEGVQTFDNEINEGIDKTKDELKNLDGIEEFAENPVEFKTEEYGKVDSYGLAFTPLFICIGLWVGALMCYVVFYYDQRNRFAILGHDAKNKFLQNIIYIGIGALQGFITACLLKVGLGFEVQNGLLYYMSSILIGITFMSIIQFLIRNLGDIGKFLALIILVLQLAASGGTFPVETIDNGFKIFTNYLPMTYCIKLFREILIPTGINGKVGYIVVLFIIAIVAFILTTIADVVKCKMVEKKHNKKFVN